MKQDSPAQTRLDPARVARLHEVIDGLGSAAVAFSAGVDSTLVLKVCADRLGDRAVAVLGVSDSLPPGEREEARTLAAHIGAPLVEVKTREMEQESYTRNPVDRCYFCKTELYRHVVPFARERGLRHVVDGLNVDDESDFRPGRRAAEEAGVRHPLREAGFGKAEIRQLARQLGLPNWDKPALACLSSRIPHGTPVTSSTLAQIGRAETALKELGLSSCRVRFHGDVARIEVPAADLPAAFAHRAEIVPRLLACGFRHVCLDLEGYRAGSLNPVNGVRQTDGLVGPTRQDVGGSGPAANHGG